MPRLQFSIQASPCTQGFEQEKNFQNTVQLVHEKV